MINVNFNSVIQLIKAFPNEQVCIDHLTELRWNGKVVSPFVETSKVYKCAGNKYRCKNTGKYFNVRTATLFDNTKVELQTWFVAIYLITGHKKGISSLRLAKDLKVTQKTAWFMLQRIRNCFGIENNHELDNEVESDESFISVKNKNRYAIKKIENSQEQSVKDKRLVFGMLKFSGKFVPKKVLNKGCESLTPEIVKDMKESLKINTDVWLGFNSLQRIYDYIFVKNNQGENVNCLVHTNRIKNFWPLLKHGIICIYHFTSKKHLQKYVDEFVFRYNTHVNQEMTRYNFSLSNKKNRLIYNELIK